MAHTPTRTHSVKLRQARHVLYRGFFTEKHGLYCMVGRCDCLRPSCRGYLLADDDGYFSCARLEDLWVANERGEVIEPVRVLFDDSIVSPEVGDYTVMVYGQRDANHKRPELDRESYTSRDVAMARARELAEGGKLALVMRSVPGHWLADQVAAIDGCPAG